MKKLLLLSGALWVLFFSLPLFLPKSKTPLPESCPDLLSEPVTATDDKIDKTTRITLLDNGEVKELFLDEYLEGVVAAEMPALFPEEALKAQAVAARTYAINRASLKPPDSHNGAMLCSDPAHCKAYLPLSAAAGNWGISRDVYCEKIQKAVRETDGEILLYDNMPISAVFHSTSSGKTERAADVWGNDVPYLQSVESLGEELSPRYEGTLQIKAADFSKKFKALYADAVFDKDPSKWFAASTRSEAGGIISLRVGGIMTSGAVIRNMLGLRSTNFTVKHEGDNLTFRTLGYGHGVGMSQYGARALAERGKTYREILEWYYKGISFGKIETTSG